MSNYEPTQPILDFVNRTLTLAEEFKKDKYNTTLQVNLLFGALILVKAQWYKQLNKITLKNGDVQGITISSPQIETNEFSLKEVLHCLRNGLAHWRERDNNNLEFFSDQTGQINTLKISGSGNVNKKFNKKHIEIDVTFDIPQDGLLNFMKYIHDKIKSI